MQVETALARIALGALGVGADQLALDFVRAPSVVLFAPGQVPLASGALKVLIAVVELLELQDVLEQGVAALGHLAYLGEQLLILEVQAPVALKVVALWMILGELE